MKLPDNHFYRVDSDAQTLLLWDVKRHAAAALGHLCAEEHPLSWRRLGHDVKVDLCKNSSFKHDVWRLKGFRQPVLCCHAWLPSPQLESPCPEGHTWSDLWWPAGCLQGTRRRSLDGWQSRSAIGVKINQVRKGVFFKTRTKKHVFSLEIYIDKSKSSDLQLHAKCTLSVPNSMYFLWILRKSQTISILQWNEKISVHSSICFIFNHYPVFAN